jgi:hypothetical protein
MKKLLTIAALAGVASLSYGQGYVNFTSQVGAGGSTNSVGSSNGGSGPTGVTTKNSATATYYYALFTAPTTAATLGATVTGDPTTSGWTFTGDYATNGSKGNFSGNGATDTSSVTVPGYGPGSTADFMIVGWSANIGSTWAAAEAVLDGTPPAGASGYGGYYNIGDSTVGQQVLAPAGGPYNNVLGAASSGEVPGIVLGTYPVPEPCTFALCGLGAAALVIFRRRN